MSEPIVQPDLTTTTITVTAQERAMITRALTVSAALVDALGDDAHALLVLWERIEAGGER